MGRPAVRRCAAHQCPDEIDSEAPESAVLCPAHWILLPGVFKDWLADAWEKDHWRDVLAECKRELRRLEAERVT